MSDAPRRWFRFRLRTLLLLTFLTVVAASVYSYWSDYVDQSVRRERELLSPVRGAYCVVYLDAGGSNDEHDRVANGHFFLMNDEWIVLTTDSRTGQIWIPRSRVKRLEVETPK